MDVNMEFDYFRKEHTELLQFVDEWDRAVEHLASPEDVERLRGLTQLRELETDLLGLRGHCLSEERHLEWPYRAYLHREEIDKLAEDHRELGRQVQDMLLVLRFATIDQTEGIPAQGKKLEELIRQHLAFEEKLLTEIERNLEAEEEERMLLRYTVLPD